TGLTSKPFFISIGLLKDREPRVTLRATGVGRRVTPVAKIPLIVGATDDFGLASLQVQLERTTYSAESKPETRNDTLAVELPSGQAVLDHQARHEVLLAADPPKTGTLLRIQAHATDQCARGAQAGQSSVLQFQVVSADELFYDILIRQRAERAKFAALLESATKQQEVLAGTPRGEDFLAVLREQRTAARQIDQSAGRIADALTEMQLN